MLALTIYACKPAESGDFKVMFVPLDAAVGPDRSADEFVNKEGLSMSTSGPQVARLFQQVDGSAFGVTRPEYFLNLRVKLFRKKDGRVIWVTAEKYILSEADGTT